LKQASGATPYVGCDGPAFNETSAGKGSKDGGQTVLSEVWYFMHVNGRPQDKMPVPIDSTSASTCATSENAVWYYERTQGSEE
jgi:ribonuclease T2